MSAVLHDTGMKLASITKLKKKYLTRVSLLLFLAMLSSYPELSIKEKKLSFTFKYTIESLNQLSKTLSEALKLLLLSI